MYDGYHDSKQRKDNSQAHGCLAFSICVRRTYVTVIRQIC